MFANAKRFCWLTSIVITLIACQPVSITHPLATSSPLPTFELPANTLTPQLTSADLPTALPTIPASIIESDGAKLPPGVFNNQICGSIPPDRFCI